MKKEPIKFLENIDKFDNHLKWLNAWIKKELTMRGVFGKVLRVNLDAESFSEEIIQDSVYESLMLDYV